ncbi:hypothetical protein BOTBODRAFT_284122 [Botryobasidium botryosum FD-172 SS1]|uniref:Uncharacterized protein n=1 Tax=Botryobasidium botryosum (strain FD-172 SS1) TaxID=930990 RepID=A0A067MJB8_BOTB1|nr:hypothetical protein BOTBODRAFT_284122 [Botryobasidium botryosum FD-172 SS1]
MCTSPGSRTAVDRAFYNTSAIFALRGVSDGKGAAAEAMAMGAGVCGLVAVCRIALGLIAPLGS